MFFRKAAVESADTAENKEFMRRFVRKGKVGLCRHSSLHNMVKILTFSFRLAIGRIIFPKKNWITGRSGSRTILRALTSQSHLIELSKKAYHEEIYFFSFNKSTCISFFCFLFLCFIQMWSLHPFQLHSLQSTYPKVLTSQQEGSFSSLPPKM